MKWVNAFKKFFMDKKNLELQSLKYKNRYSSVEYINLFSLKEIVISNEIYNNSKIFFPENLKLYSKIHTHIFDSLSQIFELLNHNLKNISEIKRHNNPFLYSFKINTYYFKKGYIFLEFYPNILLTNEQKKLLNELFLKEFFLFSNQLLISSPYLTESEKYINKYSHLNIKDSVEILHNKLSDLLNHFSEENKRKNIFDRYSKFKRKQSYF